MDNRLILVQCSVLRLLAQESSTIFLALAYLTYSTPGSRTLPYTLVSSMFSVISGFMVSKIGRNLPAIWFGSTLITVGTGLLVILDYNSSMCVFLLLRCNLTMFSG